MSQLNEISDWLQENLPRLVAEHGVPGAAVAVTVGDEVAEAAAGVLSRNSLPTGEQYVHMGVRATPKVS
ncbi:hypothetical protein V1227_10310 [Lentzea sp. DG1S-22]|uniref:hypothetical protein n=1 Tax=Lentzea sp. DG1S-22 TaxID=3108822 RepID=UPI002E78311E|nr:hypothetical protein [Lentzea sp. DG1S-22]WVH83115.1 hypothetical protein V1227_10310 [Lentzea sp. DG1S-22]